MKKNVKDDNSVMVILQLIQRWKVGGGSKMSEEAMQKDCPRMLWQSLCSSHTWKKVEDFTTL